MKTVSVLSDSGFVSDQLEIGGICHKNFLSPYTNLAVVGNKPIGKAEIQHIMQLCRKGLVLVFTSPGSGIAGKFGFKAKAGKSQIKIKQLEKPSEQD